MLGTPTMPRGLQANVEETKRRRPPTAYPGSRYKLLPLGPVYNQSLSAKPANDHQLSRSKHFITEKHESDKPQNAQNPSIFARYYSNNCFTAYTQANRSKVEVAAFAAIILFILPLLFNIMPHRSQISCKVQFERAFGVRAHWASLTHQVHSLGTLENAIEMQQARQYDDIVHALRQNLTVQIENRSVFVAETFPLLITLKVASDDGDFAAWNMGLLNLHRISRPQEMQSMLWLEGLRTSNAIMVEAQKTTAAFLDAEPMRRMSLIEKGLYEDTKRIYDDRAVAVHKDLRNHIALLISALQNSIEKVEKRRDKEHTFNEHLLALYSGTRNFASLTDLEESFQHDRLRSATNDGLETTIPTEMRLSVDRLISIFQNLMGETHLAENFAAIWESL